MSKTSISHKVNNRDKFNAWIQMGYEAYGVNDKPKLIKLLIEKGATLQEIGDVLGISRQSVFEIVKREGVRQQNVE